MEASSKLALGLLLGCAVLHLAAAGRAAASVTDHGHTQAPSPAPSSVVTVTNASNLVGGISIAASATFAKQAYPFCQVAPGATSFFLQPTVRTVNETTKTGTITKYIFTIVEDVAACRDIAKMAGRNDTSICNRNLHSVMLTVSEMCMDAVMHVNMVQLTWRAQNATKETSMLCHAHKGHDTGIPLLKYAVRPEIPPSTTAPLAKRLYYFTLIITDSAKVHPVCKDLTTLCGGRQCQLGLSDYEYDICPAYLASL